jgi:hypothetical protein
MRSLLRSSPFVLQGFYQENCFLNGSCSERTFPLTTCRKGQSMCLQGVSNLGHTCLDLTVL